MRSAPGRDGIVTSRWPCWPMPIWPLCVSTPSGGEDLDLAADVLPLTVPEVRRLLWRLIWARPPDPGRIRAWSDWRRRHQQRARRSHWTRRTRTHQTRLSGLSHLSFAELGEEACKESLAQGSAKELTF